MAQDNEALDIDLYQARMLIAFYRVGMKDVQGTMEAFVRKLPSNRRFLVVCGVERILEYLNNLRITDDDISVFKEVLPEIKFDDDLCSYLKNIDFAKELTVRAMPEGQIAFANEPLVSISGPVGVAQYVEKKVLSILNHDVRIASKAARVFIAANGKPLAEFGGRRGGDKMSAEAGRAAFIGGFNSTSNVLAFKKYGIPCSGTMGHVWVMAHVGEDGEERAYKNWSTLFEKSIYLPDTYNTINGCEKITKLCRGRIDSIRLDSGNLAEDSFNVKRLLNNSDNYATKIGATNDLNEYKIKDLLSAGCPFDWFGVGTEVVATPDSPTCNFIYKLVHVDDKVRGSHLVAKLAAGGKGTLPGAKQVWRGYDERKGLYTHDVLSLNVEYDSDTSMHKMGFLPRLAAQNWSPNRNAAERAQKLFINSLRIMPPYLKIISEHDDSSMQFPVELSPSLQQELNDFKNRNLHKLKLSGMP